MIEVSGAWYYFNLNIDENKLKTGGKKRKTKIFLYFFASGESTERTQKKLKKKKNNQISYLKYKQKSNHQHQNNFYCKKYLSLISIRDVC